MVVILSDIIIYSYHLVLVNAYISLILSETEFSCVIWVMKEWGV